MRGSAALVHILSLPPSPPRICLRSRTNTCRQSTQAPPSAKRNGSAQRHRASRSCQTEMSEGSGPGPPGAGAVQTSPTVAPSDIVTVWLEKAAGPKSAIPLKSSMKKSFSAANVTSHSGRPSSVRSPPRVSISPTTSLTASIGAQLAKHAAYLSSAAARARTNILLRSSETDSAAGLTAQRYRGITGIKAWGKGVILKAYQARGGSLKPSHSLFFALSFSLLTAQRGFHAVQREKGFRKPLHPGEGDSHDQTVKEASPRCPPA